jgi:hypothetical protein
MCYGRVRGNEKLVVLPELRRALRFDLASDPDERRPLPVGDDAPELAELGKLAAQLRLPNEPAYAADLKLDNGWTCPAADYCTHPKTPPNLFFAPSQADKCVQVKPNAVSKQEGYDHKLSLHNACAGSMICQVELLADSSGSQTIKLKPDESRDLVLDHEANDAAFKYRVDCQFL